MDFPTDAVKQSVDPDRVPRILLANLYPKQVWYFMATFIGLVAACHAISLLHAHWTRKQAPPSADAPLRHGVSWRRLPLATLNLFRTITFRWSIVVAGSYTLNVADFLLATMYLGVLFTWTFINSKNLKGQKYDPKYWANRCAHIAGSQLPLMTAFGMKNNFMSYCPRVRIRFSRSTPGSKWVSRLADDPTEYWFKIGVTGASALTLLCLLSVRPLRSRSYEFFMYIHLVLGILTLVGAYIHSAEFGYGAYIWPAMFLWGLDRFLRIVRISFVNSQLFPTNSNSNSTKIRRGIASDATVTVLSPHFLRILVDTPPYFIWRAGQSAYITICGAYPTSITEAHPFTITNAPHEDGLPGSDGAASASSVEEGSNEEKADSTKESEKVKENAPRQLTFILRVREGFTKRLVDSVLANPNSNGVSRSFKAFIDGPYSSPPVVRGYETVVFILSPSTCTTVRSNFIFHRAARAKTNSRCSRVVFVWAIRDPDQLNWIAEAVTQALSNTSAADAGPTIDIRLHVTTAPEDTQSFEGEERSSVSTDPEAAGSTVGTDPNPGIARAEKIDPAAKGRLLAAPDVKLIYGRPDIKGIVGTEIAQARGAVSVSVCGTTELAQSVRNALRDGRERFMDVLRGGPSVVLHVEGFGNT
ncbi:hypothetical protein B0H19DRAFT_970901 [Mycena capillaripes]|nr:hypothetical protein B0H19DRAFT_970901 [Mycena capillaripes]